jgi:indole-3-glycerol phosphate synthase
MHENAGATLPSILRKILSDKAGRLRESRRRLPRAELVRLCRDLPPAAGFQAVLDAAGNGSAASKAGGPPTRPPAIIAEFKRRSPSRGVIRPNFELEEIHEAYRAGGADAYSVLTEEDHFGGSLSDLRKLRTLTRIPLLRKDFLFDPYQIYESRAAGADAPLLIAAVLQTPQLTELIGLSRELSMEALVEVHSSEELSRALDSGARIVGINNRDLHTFEVDLGVSLRLAARIPQGVIVVSESGIHGPEDIRRLRAAGVHAFLVGEHLMRARDPAAALRRLRASP